MTQLETDALQAQIDAARALQNTCTTVNELLPRLTDALERIASTLEERL